MTTFHRNPQTVLNTVAEHGLASAVAALVRKHSAWSSQDQSNPEAYGLYVAHDGRSTVVLVVYCDSMDFEVDDRLDEIVDY